MRLSFHFFFAILALSFSVTNSQADVPTARIIDGTKVSETAFPAVARLQYQGDLLCTGTLIASRFILTAAHCFYDDRNRQGVGDTDIVARLNGQQYNSTKVYIHPNYRPRSSACVEGETDAAIVELASEVSGVTPITLIDSPLAAGTNLQLAGYGAQGNGQSGQDDTIPELGTINFGNTVLEGYGDNFGQNNPNSTYYYWSFDSGEANTGSGDSGGPAFLQSGGSLFLTGITCGGDGNAEIGTSSYNTRADLIKAWALAISGGTPTNTAPSFSTFKTQTATVAKAFSFTVTAGGTAPVAISASGLPSGLTLVGNTISGTPTVAGAFNVTLSASNAFGTASTNLKIVVSGHTPSVSMQRVLLQFDYVSGASDFLDITGKIDVGSKFKPSGKRVTVRIGQFVKTYKLLSNGQSNSSNKNYFDLTGTLANGVFRKSSLRFDLTIEQSSFFEDLATLGFPDSASASEGQEISLPLAVTINDIESTTTTILVYRTSDRRWHIKR